MEISEKFRSFTFSIIHSFSLYKIKNRDFNKKDRFVAFIIFLILILFSIRLFFGEVLYINTSNSCPTGIYLAVPGRDFKKGDMVVVNEPYAFPEIHIAKGSHFLKHISALEGEKYFVSGDFFYVGTKNYYIDHSLDYLPHVPEGTYTVPEGQALFMNDPYYSLDSRYFGPLPLSLVEHKAVMLVDFQKLDRFLADLLPESMWKKD